MPKVITDAKRVKAVLTRGVEKIYPSVAAFEKLLISGKRIRLYHGIDPTSPTLHLGHTVSLRKLREFQELGHEVILLIGAFTAMIGDPTGKDATRRPLTREQVIANAKSYQHQAGKILKFDGANPAKLRMNSEWFDPMSLRDFMTLSHQVTISQLLERDMFEKRLANGGSVTLPELIYPVLQGYDSVALSVDLEIGGSDQTFNMLVGRDLSKSISNHEKFVLTTPLLADASGRKIGKSEGNAIGITDAPEDLYGKIMALGDDAILPVFTLCTDLTSTELTMMKKSLSRGGNPRDAKAKLAHTIVTVYHGVEAADEAATTFIKRFRDHEAPNDMPEYPMKVPAMVAIDLLVATKLATSKSEARRLIEQAGVKIGGETITDANAEIMIPTTGIVLQRGKRQFVRVIKK